MLPLSLGLGLESPNGCVSSSLMLCSCSSHNPGESAYELDVIKICFAVPAALFSLGGLP